MPTQKPQKRTAAQIAASRRNGRRSQGPLSLEGKAVVARNAFQHGLTARTVLPRHESQDRFNQVLASLVNDFSPQTDAEFFCVEEMATAKWRMRRAWSFESQTLDAGGAPAQIWADKQPQLEACLRYETTAQRQYDRASQQLRQLQLDRALATEAEFDEAGETSPE